MKQKLFDLKCAECGKVFRNPDENERFCPDCKKIKDRRTPEPVSRAKKGIYQVMRELEQYNRKHGTTLSYGQYVASVDK